MLNPLNTEIIVGDCHPEIPRSHQFHRSETYGGGSMSIEEAQALFSLIQIIKPHHVLETGLESGFSAAYMALACELNGFGIVHSLEIDHEWAERARANLERDGVSHRVNIVLKNSMDFIKETPLTFGFALLDTSLGMRHAELMALLPKLEPQAIVAVHDSSPLHPLRGECELLRDLYSTGLQVIHLPSPRGLTILQAP